MVGLHQSCSPGPNLPQNAAWSDMRAVLVIDPPWRVRRAFRFPAGSARNPLAILHAVHAAQPPKET
jgi:alkyl hydroperoxide reductase subunit AhpC